MVIGEFEETEKFIRARQIEPEELVKDSFKTIRLASGIKAIVGLKEGSESPLVQSVLFDKTKFAKHEAKIWMKNNKTKFADAIALEYKKDSLFQDDPLSGHLQGHLPPLSRAQLMRLLEIAGKPDEGEEEYLEERDDEVSHFDNKYIHIE